MWWTKCREMECTRLSVSERTNVLSTQAPELQKIMSDLCLNCPLFYCRFMTVIWVYDKRPANGSGECGVCCIAVIKQ